MVLPLRFVLVAAPHGNERCDKRSMMNGAKDVAGSSRRCQRCGSVGFQFELVESVAVPFGIDDQDARACHYEVVDIPTFDFEVVDPSVDVLPAMCRPKHIGGVALAYDA